MNKNCTKLMWRTLVAFFALTIGNSLVFASISQPASEQGKAEVELHSLQATIMTYNTIASGVDFGQGISKFEIQLRKLNAQNDVADKLIKIFPDSVGVKNLKLHWPEDRERLAGTSFLDITVFLMQADLENYLWLKNEIKSKPNWDFSDLPNLDEASK